MQLSILPVARGSAAAGIAAAKSPESAATAESAASPTPTAPTAAASAPHIAQQHAGEEAAEPAAARAQQPQQDHDSADNQRPGNRIARLPHHAPRQFHIQRNVLGFSDDRANVLSGGDHGCAVLALA